MRAQVIQYGEVPLVIPFPDEEQAGGAVPA